ncbi:MarR family winged helix-turn-helix transcriptional regulator [Schleiferilactobacillus harbinensis]|uniref:MarR family winged helix-turn-helix transcriptional regulator n=1 Tax=Schleiferilactobacillus harbinensis TaxID=304207 RepID=UPI0007B91F33|nr:MarR family transcriptional regulator [Schleiferilactobacillus harbinensis]
MPTLGYTLMAIAKDIKYQLTTALAVENITSQQWAVLAQIATAPEPLTAAAIGTILDMDRPTATAIVHRLQKKELVASRRSPVDGRAYVLSLTPAGQIAFQRCATIAEQTLHSVLQPLTAPEQRQLQQLLTKLEGKQPTHG